MQQKLCDQLTILVLTYNRYPRLLRLLKYVSSAGLPYAIHVLDSSSDPISSSELRGMLNHQGISYRKYDPAIPSMAKVTEGLREVVTPYVVLWADDDFLVPRSFEEGIRFLGANPDYSVVHGESGLFRVVSRGSRNAIQWIEPYPQRSIAHPTAAERLLAHLGRHYSVVYYSIHRTENLKKNMNHCRRYGFDHARGELLSGSLSVIQGKTKSLDCLYMLREVHPEMTSATENGGRKFDVLDWMTQTNFHSQYQQFLTCLGMELSEADGIEQPQAESIVKQAFLSYLARVIAEDYEQPFEPKPMLKSRLRELAQGLPMLRSIWYRVRPFLPGMEPELSLQALRRSTDRHHADFERIEEAVTRG